MSPSGQTVQFERYQGDLENSDRATAETVACMCKYISDAQNDPGVWAAAGEAQRWGSAAAGAFWWAKHNIKFVQDDLLVARLLNETDQLELLVTPPVMVRSSRPQGDCDDFTMMVCALLKLLGVGFEIVTVAADGVDPSRFSHVFCRAVLSDGSRIPLDASHGKYPGWCVPASRTYRIQVWDESGAPIKDAGSKWNGLHGFIAGAGRGVQGLRGFAGLGACGDCLTYDDSGNCTETDTTDCSTPVIGPPSLSTNTCPSGLVLVSGECVPPGTTLSPTLSTNSSGATTCTATSAASCPAGSIFIQGSSIPGVLSATPTLSTVGASLSPIDAALAALATSGASLANAVLGPTTPAGTTNVATSSLLLYGGLALAGVVVLSLVSGHRR